MATPVEIRSMAKATIDKYARRVGAILGVQPVHLDVEIVPPNSQLLNYGAFSASSVNGVIYLPNDFNPRDWGAVVFEMTNQYNVAKNGEDDNTMQLAQFVRDKIEGKNPSGQWAKMTPIELRDNASALRAGTYGTDAATTTVQDPNAGKNGGGGGGNAAASVSVPYPNPTTEAQVHANAEAAAQGGAGSNAGGNNDTTVVDPHGAGNDPSKRRNNQATYLSILQGYGIALDPEMRQLVSEAQKHGYSETRFLYFLRQTEDYQKTFPGIFKKDGTMKMTEEQYLTNVDSYKQYAYANGLNLGPKEQAWLFQHNVSPDEYNDKGAAIRKIEDNPALYNQFKKALVQMGVAKPNEVSKQELQNFVLGEGNAEWYHVWNLSRARYVATEAGISFGKNTERYLALNPHIAEQIANKDLTDAELATKFGAVATALGAAPGQEGAVLTLSEAKTYGVTKRDIIASQFGGKRAQRAKNKIARAQSTAEAFTQDRASQQLTEDQGGGYQVIGGTSQKAQSG